MLSLFLSLTPSTFVDGSCNIDLFCSGTLLNHVGEARSAVLEADTEKVLRLTNLDCGLEVGFIQGNNIYKYPD